MKDNAGITAGGMVNYIIHSLTYLEEAHEQHKEVVEMFDIPFEYSETFTIIMYFAPALISLIALWFINKKFVWISIPITIIADLIAFWSALTNYEFWELALVFLIPQIIVVTAILLIIMRIYRKNITASK